jgi:LysM repeat protein
VSNRAPITTWRGAGCNQTSSVVREASNDDVMKWESYRKPNGLSTDYAKHNQTMATGSTASEPTTGTPLQQGDALVAYENVKREKNSEGKENGEIKFDINVCRV